MMLNEVLAGVMVGEAVGWKGLSVFPLSHGNGHAPAYALIDELLESKQAQITELDDMGSVPTVKVLNHADVDALILDGMELHGAKQNRMVNVTVVIGRHSETEIPVSCVEQGRWSYRSKGFASAKRTVASKLRRAKAHMVAGNLALREDPRADQGGVWDHVEEYLAESEVRSGTSALHDMFTARNVDIGKIEAKLKEIDAHGAVVVLNGEIVALDLMDSRETFKKLWLMLLRGYAADAVLETPAKRVPVTKGGVESWLRTVASGAELRQHRVPGVGRYYAVRGNDLAGGVVMHQDRCVHVALFTAA